MNQATTSIGPMSVRRSIHIAADGARVWKEFESFERMAAWWGTGHTLEVYEPREGGTVEMSVEIGGSRLRYGGRIVVFEPGRELTWENNWIPPQNWPVPTYITLRLTPAEAGTVVELFHHGFERLGRIAGDEHVGYEQGWTLRQLEALRGIVRT